jgi:hypothetical protein
VKSQVRNACAETQPFSETAFVRIVDIGIWRLMAGTLHNC